jgi:hypothetical protein
VFGSISAGKRMGVVRPHPLIEYNEGEAGKGDRAMCRKSVLAMVLATTLLLAAFGSCERRICAPGGF